MDTCILNIIILQTTLVINGRNILLYYFYQLLLTFLQLFQCFLAPGMLFNNSVSSCHLLAASLCVKSGANLPEANLGFFFKNSIIVSFCASVAFAIIMLMLTTASELLTTGWLGLGVYSLLLSNSSRIRVDTNGIITKTSESAYLLFA